VIPHLKSPQTDNSSPNKLFIYMLFQKPVVTSNCRSIAQVIEENECGLIFPSGDAQALAQSILQLYRNKDQRLQMGQNAARAVREKYDWNTTVQPLIQMYRDLES
jgi:glycosyltransferase involved in cell wall biosynthesis